MSKKIQSEEELSKSLENWSTEILDTNNQPYAYDGHFDLVNCISNNLGYFGYLGMAENSRIGEFAIIKNAIEKEQITICANTLGIVYGDRHNRIILYVPDQNVYIGWIPPEDYDIKTNVHFYERTQ